MHFYLSPVSSALLIMGRVPFLLQKEGYRPEIWNLGLPVAYLVLYEPASSQHLVYRCLGTTHLKELGGQEGRAEGCTKR